LCSAKPHRNTHDLAMQRNTWLKPASSPRPSSEAEVVGTPGITKRKERRSGDWRLMFQVRAETMDIDRRIGLCAGRRNEWMSRRNRRHACLLYKACPSILCILSKIIKQENTKIFSPSSQYCASTQPFYLDIGSTQSQRLTNPPPSSLLI
jgi:hypothetical protein